MAHQARRPVGHLSWFLVIAPEMYLAAYAWCVYADMLWRRDADMSLLPLLPLLLGGFAIDARRRMPRRERVSRAASCLRLAGGALAVIGFVTVLRTSI